MKSKFTFILILLLILITFGLILPSGLRATITNNLWSIRFLHGDVAQTPPATHPHADLFLARQAFDRGDIPQALARITPLVDAADPIAMHTYAGFLYADGGYEQAFDIWGTTGGEVTLEQAYREMQADGDKDAIFWASQNLYRINPEKFATTYVNALAAQNKSDQAMAILEETLEIYPDSRFRSIWWRYKADIHKAQGEYIKAESAYRQALLINPEELKALRDLGLMYRGQLNDTTNAIATFKQYIAQSPQEVYGYLLLAQTYEEAQMRDLAIQTYQRALKVDPANATAQAALQRLSADDSP